jgi:chloramphenicol-sensitive protein RarD
MNRGLGAAAGAYLLWGVLPVYWKALTGVSAFDILAHRIVWSAVVLAVVLVARRDRRWVGNAVRDRRTLVGFIVTAVLLATNWVVYVWSNNHGHMVEGSLGYFVTPLVSVVLGLVVLHERLRPGQWLAVAVAATGVAYLTLNAGGALWISAALALSFGFYGLLRKTARLGSVHGLSLEMMILLAPALVYLTWLGLTGDGAFVRAGTHTTLLLAGSGVVTAAPLVLFAYGARRVTLVTLGILQYCAPTLQFLLGVVVYHEPFGHARLVGFVIVWAALAVYSVEGIVARRRSR